MNIDKSLYNGGDIKVATGKSDENFIVFTERKAGMVVATREEAIAAARAILKHFNCEPGPIGK